MFKSVRVFYHTRTLDHALQEIERYRKHRRWLRAQHKRVIAARKPLASMPSETREDRIEINKYLRTVDKVAQKQSPHAAGDTAYANRMTRYYAGKRDRHRRVLKALGV